MIERAILVRNNQDNNSALLEYSHPLAQCLKWVCNVFERVRGKHETILAGRNI